MNILHFNVNSEHPSDSWCVYSHFDKNNKIESYVIGALRDFKKSGLNVIFVSTSEKISEADLIILKELVNIISIRDNIGYDFGSYKLGIQYLYNNKIHPKQLLITNDSVFGPIFDIEPFLKKSMNFDFYGMTDSIDYLYHIQSYFIVYNEKLLTHPSFKQFWDSVELIDSNSTDFKTKIITEYEVGGTQFFIKNGFKLGVEFGISRIATTIWENFKSNLESAQQNPNIKVENLHIGSNTTHNYWKALLSMGYPYLKRELITRNPTNTEIYDWPKYLQEISHYNVGIIIDALFNFHGNDSFIYTNNSIEFIIKNIDENGEIELPASVTFLKFLKCPPRYTSKVFYFDEDYYLSTNLDVKLAIEKGEGTSGLSHFINNGYKEQRRFLLTPK